MSRRYLQYPALLIDPKKPRIRVYRSTLHALGDPEYIVLIVNPFGQSITVMRSESSDQRAYSLKHILNNTDMMLEFFNGALIKNLFAINRNWNRNQAYRIHGEISSDGIEAIFNFSDSIVFLGEQEWK